MYFNQLCIFRAMFSPIIRSISMLLRLLVMSTDVAAAATSVDSCSYSDMLLMMGENIARKMQS